MAESRHPGTALYIQDTLYSGGADPQIPEAGAERWNGAVRLRITRLGSIDSWFISPPEIVYTGATTDTGNEPGELAARPRPEGFVCTTGSDHCDLILVTDNSNLTTTRRIMLDVEQCISAFNPAPAIAPDFWSDCLVTEDPFTGDPFNLGDAGTGSWQSPDHVLDVVREKRHKTSVFRTNIHDGVSTKLVDNAESPDGGK